MSIGDELRKYGITYKKGAYHWRDQTSATYKDLLEQARQAEST